jgi:hypothetical protein
MLTKLAQFNAAYENLLGDFNPEVSREDIFKSTIRNDSFARN